MLFRRFTGHIKLASMRSLTICRELPGLPGDGEFPRQFSATGQGMHREGYVVEFTPSGDPSWVGNFQPGGGILTGIFEFLESQSVLVVARGQGYLVDAQTGALLGQYESDIAIALPITAGVLVGTSTDFSAYRGGIRVWRTRRISWDGFRNLSIKTDNVLGEAWCFDDSWHKFKIELANGEVEGGSYYE